MKRFIDNNIGRFRLIAFLEGISLIILVFIGVPLKYFMDAPTMVEVIGPIHGGLFLLYVLIALRVGFEEGWKFFATTWLVLLASFVPFGTFYIDSKILRPLHAV
jgi:integral membrane protein